jgi:hypothetical protein
MNKQDIDSILLANWYFTTCKIESPSSERTELARKYLVSKVGRVLGERVQTNTNPIYSLFSFF